MAFMLTEKKGALDNHFLFLVRCFCRSNLRAKADGTPAFISYIGIWEREFQGKILGAHCSAMAASILPLRANLNVLGLLQLHITVLQLFIQPVHVDTLPADLVAFKLGDSHSRTFGSTLSRSCTIW